VPKYVLIDNGILWPKTFEGLCYIAMGFNTSTLDLSLVQWDGKITHQNIKAHMEFNCDVCIM
jgi:hypothetical protein